MDFISNLTHVKLSIALLVLALPFTYQIYAKRWSACTGRHFTKGKVLWSSYDYTGSYGSNRKVGIIDFNYWVDGELFHSYYYCPRGSGDYYVKKYPAGSVIPVFYSIKDPSYCVIDSPPSSFKVLFDSIGSYIISPLIVANTGLVIWRLF